MTFRAPSLVSLFLFLLPISGVAVGATASSGLQDPDTLQFGLSVVRSYTPNYSTGGVSVSIFGRKRANLTSEDAIGKVYASGELRKFMDYVATIEHFDESNISKTELRTTDKKTPLAHNESFSGKVSGQAINAVLEKAKTDCPDCTKFYVAVMQDTGWGTFDILPIQNYTSFHSLNSRPGFTYHVDTKGQVTGTEVFNNFIEYRQSED